MTPHRGFQLAVRNELQALIDAQRKVLAGTRTADVFDVIHDLATTIAKDALGTRLTSQRLVEGKLQPLLTIVFDVGKPEHMAEHLTCRVVPLVFALDMHAGNPIRLHHGHHVFRLGRRHPPLEINETALAVACQPCAQVFRVHLQHLRQGDDPLCTRTEHARVRGNRIDRRAQRQDVAAAIRDKATVGRDLDLGQIAVGTLGLQEVLLQDLLIDGTPDQGGPRQHEQRPAPYSADPHSSAGPFFPRAGPGAHACRDGPPST